jgi:hypothetical protein
MEGKLRNIGGNKVSKKGRGRKEENDGTERKCKI